MFCSASDLLNDGYAICWGWLYTSVATSCKQFTQASDQISLLCFIVQGIVSLRMLSCSHKEDNLGLLAVLPSYMICT